MYTLTNKQTNKKIQFLPKLSYTLNVNYNNAYIQIDHSTWRAFMHKYPKWHYNFNSGDAYFCIPPYPFRGEVETYNFFISTDLWK